MGIISLTLLILAIFIALTCIFCILAPSNRRLVQEGKEIKRELDRIFKEG